MNQRPALVSPSPTAARWLGAAARSLAVGAASAACSSASSGAGTATAADSVNAICQKLVACGTADSTTGTPYTLSSCLSDFTGWIPPAGCADALTSASCGDVNGAGSAAQATCFPSCPSVGATICQGDDIAVCTGAPGAASGTTLVETCDAFCAASGATYTGVCGASDHGQASPSGQDICWCSGGGDDDASTGSPPPTGSSEGTPDPCSSNSTLETCGADVGCAWQLLCGGSVNPCADNHDELDCGEQLGCSWDSIAYACEGTPLDCDSIPAYECYPSQGCRQVSLCRGEPFPCAHFTTAASCTAVSGCSWQ